MLYNGKTRTALCFSGQPRTWRKCVESWKNYILSDDVDVFCHIWDYNSLPNSIMVGVKIPYELKVPPGEIDELMSILKPKKLKVESSRTFSVNENQPIPVQSYLSQYYGICQGANLKKEYEIENNIMYHRVLRVRYDAMFYSDMKPYYDIVAPMNQVECFHYGWDHLTCRGRMGDIFWQADSRTHDLISDYYMNIQYINPKYVGAELYPEHTMYHYIKKNNIKMNVNHWDVKVCRESQALSFTKDKNGFETW